MKKANAVVDKILGKESPKEERKNVNKEAKSKEDKIKEMKEQKCGFPGCDGEQLMTISLPIVSYDEKGNLQQEGDENSHISIPVPVCSRHVHAFMSGTFALLKSEQGYSLIGPVETVLVVEMMLAGFKAELLKELKKE